jgi:hypothetical protein
MQALDTAQIEYVRHEDTMARAGHAVSTQVTPSGNHSQDYVRTLSYRTCTGNFVSIEFVLEPDLELKFRAQTRGRLWRAHSKRRPRMGC